jgi:hypothetical protein
MVRHPLRGLVEALRPLKRKIKFKNLIIFIKKSNLQAFELSPLAAMIF